jgi:hypothetical protein
MKHWWCVECQEKVRLGKHGRCEICESEAVDLLPTDGELSRQVSTTDKDSDPALAHAGVGVGD